MDPSLAPEVLRRLAEEFVSECNRWGGDALGLVATAAGVQRRTGMGFNPRLRIACAKCDGLGVFDVHAETADDLAVCPVCRGNGRDVAAETRLAELVWRIPNWIIWLALPGYDGMQRDAEELLDLLTTAGTQPGTEPAAGSE